MLIAIAIAEEIQGLKSFASSESFKVLSFPWIWQEVWLWTVANLLCLSVPQELTPSSGFLVACMPKITRSQFEILKAGRKHHWDSPQIKPVKLKLLAKVKEHPEAQNLQNFDAILWNPWISSAMTMAMSIYRTLCVLVPENFTPRDAHCFWQWYQISEVKISEIRF